MFEKLINILETYGTDIRSTRSMISARKDVGDLALVFNILKFSDDFMIFIAFEGIDGKWITVWETTIPATNEQELHSTVGKWEMCLRCLKLIYQRIVSATHLIYLKGL